MTRTTRARWITGLITTVVLAFGVLQLVQGNPLGWAAAASAALMYPGIGLLAHKIIWGQLLASWAVVTAAAWLLSMLFELVGWDGFSYAGWGVGIGVTVASFLGEYKGERAKQNGRNQGQDRPPRHRGS